MKGLRTISVLGAGRAGRELARLFYLETVFNVGSVMNRTVESSREAVSSIGSGSVAELIIELCTADIIMIAVPDDQIAMTAEKLAQCPVRPGTVAFHLSGLRSSDDLVSLAKIGCEVASVHPARSFSANAPGRFKGTPCAVEGSDVACALVEDAFSKIGGEVFKIDRNQKTLYHASTVMMSNYIVALLNCSTTILEHIGLSNEQISGIQKSLAPQAVQNFLQNGPQSLTGPVSRGDIATVENEMKALSGYHDGAAVLYRTLGKAAMEIAANSGHLTSQQVLQLKELLSE